ncbi:MAG: hypothetical protein JO043_07870, partial [Candidatus Eremiobacteraeota bacterium]|nr:hypothetical protein [Candidatus Eremiobacteraeota bacterium]
MRDTETTYESLSVPATSSSLLRDRRLYLFIIAVFAIKAAAMIGFSYYEVRRAALTMDFGIFYQAWSLISHGKLNPFSTMISLPFYEDHFAIALWPMAILGMLTQSPLVLKAIQDLLNVGADLLAAFWTLDIVRGWPSLSTRAALALLVAAMLSLALNPWT